ncbi:glycosyl transferase [[Phormidium ambiguum] IAM M-71]|uniref:Glycosyl transferase n=1 Tax=[Phormidium ambiguum] IAM M-71 TaxID=454136 RepID=A0A1U7ISJ9_9CYAN|nr:glycosyltransferase [Phormidium ambiguum]OKH40429.1 glycosyl transferase [Phormidium ambiguum IAM M-71]
MFDYLWRLRIFKFILGGGLAAALNLLLIYWMIEWLAFNTPVLRNIANVVSIEISLLFSFFIYRIWVWPGGAWTIREVFLRQIPLYHLSAGASVITRVFLIFPLLDWLGVNYVINTIFGVLVSAAINYLISDKLVFQTHVKPTSTPTTDLYYPEGLEPALADNSDLPKFTGREMGRSQLPNTGRINFLSVVIPAYNEEGSIAETVECISKLLGEHNIVYEILVVNDNSRDRTEEILQQLNVENSRVRYINNYYPNGFGFAVRCGLENFQGDAVAVMMADNSDDPQNLVDYYYKLQQGYDCVFGSRFIKGGKVIDYPLHKLTINRLANLFVQVLFGLKFNDTTNAFKAYRREVIDGVSPLLSHHFNLTVEIPLKAIVRGYSYTTIPIVWRNRKTGISKLKIKEMGSRYLFIVLYVFLEKWLSRGDYIRQNSHGKPKMKTN